jgi:hypothetical protein
MRHAGSQARRATPWVVILAGMSAAFFSIAARATPVQLSKESFAPVVFEGIPATTYRFDGVESDAALTAAVDKSASFLLAAFPTARPVHRIAFEWRADGAPLTADAAAEETKAGDDATLRVGLLLAGDPPMFPMMAPAWLKAVRDTLKAPAASLLYLTVGAKHAANTRWTSPHSGSIESLALPSVAGDAGWQKSEVAFSAPLAVVGLWIMADGDDTKAKFTAALRRLTID